LAVLPLHGDLAPEQQDAALLPLPRRKIVLATNVAETSVTVAGITGVVDTGLARQLLFDPAVGLDRLGGGASSEGSGGAAAGAGGADTAGRVHPALGRARSPGPTRADRAGDSPGGPGRGRAAASLPRRNRRAPFPLAGTAARSDGGPGPGPAAAAGSGRRP